MFCVHPDDPPGMLDTFPFIVHGVTYKHIMQYVLRQRAVLAEDYSRSARYETCNIIKI